MQIEQGGIVYEVVRAKEPLTEEDLRKMLEVYQQELGDLWDIVIPENASEEMKQILEDAQEKVEERRIFLEGEIFSLEDGSWQ